MSEELNIFSGITEEKETGLINKIILVRHAESVANTQGKYQGQTYDTDLSLLGQKQALALANRIKSIGIKKIISSPLKRTYQTALEVSRILDIEIDIDERITETNHGEWEGQTKEWISKNYSGLYKTWLSYPSKVKFPRGEFFSQTLKRVNDFLATNESESSLVVTHDNIVRILITLANNWPLDDIWREKVEPASLNFFEIYRKDGKTKLKTLKLNDNEHLKGINADLTTHAL